MKVRIVVKARDMFLEESGQGLRVGNVVNAGECVKTVTTRRGQCPLRIGVEVVSCEIFIFTPSYPG